jgi:hypothetical protein
MMSAGTSSPVLLTRLLIVVTTFVWPATTAATAATTGHSRFVIAASSVVGPLAPLRSRGFHLCLPGKIVRVVVPGLHRIIDARAEIVVL